MMLSQIGEFGLIERVKKRQKNYDKSVIIGIGDDAALVRPDSEKNILMTTDLLLEDIHFDLSYTSFYQIGYKAVAISISDIAAMGGVPRYLLVSIGIPQDLTIREIDELYNGIADLTERYSIDIVGGDTSRSVKGIFVSITLIGEIEQDIAVRRNNAKEGEKIFVTGKIGDSSAGLEILRSGSSEFHQMINKHHYPLPRLDEGRLLAIHGLASSMIDISDGLSSDLLHICEESKKGALIKSRDIPISRELSDYTSSTGKDPVRYALDGGEDYELLFTVDENKIDSLMEFKHEKDLDITCIGEIVAFEEGVNLIYDKEDIRPIKKGGYDHFKKY